MYCGGEETPFVELRIRSICLGFFSSQCLRRICNPPLLVGFWGPDLPSDHRRRPCRFLQRSLRGRSGNVHRLIPLQEMLDEIIDVKPDNTKE
jgi:hypothetical protein